MQPTCSKGIQEQAQLREEGDPLGIVQGTESPIYWHMHKQKAVLENKILWEF